MAVGGEKVLADGAGEQKMESWKNKTTKLDKDHFDLDHKDPK